MVYLNQISPRSFPIWIQLQTGVTFDPSISVQFTQISVIGMFNFCAMYNISTSNALNTFLKIQYDLSQLSTLYHLSTCKLSKQIWAARRVSNLNPHWVSFIPLTANNHTKKWKPYIKMVRKKLLLAMATSSRWAREPTLIPNASAAPCLSFK